MDFQSWTQTHTVYHLELEEEKQSRKNGFKDKNSILRTETWKIGASLTIKKAECQSIDALNCVVGGLLRVPWHTRRSNQSILKNQS